MPARYAAMILRRKTLFLMMPYYADAMPLRDADARYELIIALMPFLMPC